MYFLQTRYKDHSHSTTAKLFDDAVMRDGPANHGGLMVGRMSGKSTKVEFTVT